jgi:hypothetical protein
MINGDIKLKGISNMFGWAFGALKPTKLCRWIKKLRTRLDSPNQLV